MFFPVSTDRTAAPDRLLKIISGDCKASSRKNAIVGKLDSSALQCVHRVVANKHVKIQLQSVMMRVHKYAQISECNLNLSYLFS